MITGCPMKPPILMEWIPSGLILGLKMDLAEENLVVSLAKAAGIKNIYKSYINAKNELDAYKIKNASRTFWFGLRFLWYAKQTNPSSEAIAFGIRIFYAVEL